MVDMQSVYCLYTSAEPPLQARRLFHSMAAPAVISFLAFLFEARKLGFVLPFSYGVSHAYSYFHVSGARYPTVSCVLVPSLFVVYSLMMSCRGGGLARDQGFWLGLLMVVLSLAVSVLYVSRFRLVLTMDIVTFIYISMSGTSSLVYVGVLMAYMTPAYLLLTIVRSHSAGYLNGVSEMKNSHTSVFITQPYTYITSNYSSFNCLVEQLESHSPGLHMLFPVRAPTGFKFLLLVLVSLPLFVIEKELTTPTLLYDTYHDFDTFGTVLLGALLGTACYFLVGRRREMPCPAGHIIYAQITMYMMLSFLTIWFSNLATWLHLAVIGTIYTYAKS